jgi:hypothetical protein
MPEVKPHFGRNENLTSMHPFETTLMASLERGENLTIGLFGGWTPLLSAASEIGSGRLMPEFLRLALTALADALESEKLSATDFICRCVEVAHDDLVLIEAVDLLDESRPLPGDGDDRCFTRFLAVASDSALMPMARAAALDGAFRWALAAERRRQLQVLAFLLGIQNDDDPIFLVRAAKIMGVAYSYWHEVELIKHLRNLSDVEGADDEAAFELGMARLTDGLETNDQSKAKEAFNAARYWFGISAERREQRPDAAVYARCLDVLDAFSRGEKPERLSEIASSIADDMFQMDAWHTDESDPPWLGTRHVERTCWNMLVLNLRRLSAELEEASWWEPAVVVKQHVVASYVASRRILKRSRTGGVESIVRPRIENALARHEGQAYALRTWLRQNTEDEWAEAARELSQRLDALIAEGVRPRPPEATTALSPVVALIVQAKIPDDAKIAALTAIDASRALLLGNLSEAEMAIYLECEKAVSESPDFTKNATGKDLFCAVLFWTLRFLNNRLEMTQGDAPVAYLFERDNHKLPREEELQEDYFQFMFSIVGGSEIEVSNVGGGRADVRFKLGGERLVVEVKREDSDCSFDGLKNSYAAQASDYQNVSVRLGLLLVLDQTEVRKSGTPHISTLVHPSRIVRKGETDPRWLVIVKVPGRRLRPSDLSK